ncbi:p21-C-terminal region-binding protein-domain-containing protein [Tuber borchii]|uniref:Protein BCP1 n=1 Tax=Tuber borchii TaxID=42251 RepID=A0A2T6ZRN2_TUBBO|nr:p21-C-terminal region-binding protein-domain-containing protein [Tuber borchii]
MDIVNVDFEMFDPQPDHDFHGLKTLLRQLFDVDNTLFDLSALTDLILSQPLLGTTVKVDGNESDPYAFLTVLNLQEHKDKPIVQELVKYILARSQSSPSLNKKLKELLSSSAPSHTGLILTERLINVPAEIVPPMYKMLLEEISWAIEENEPYNFSNFLILSKTYTEIPSKIDALESRQQKKGKKGSSKSKNLLFYFHPEDETIQRSGEHASYKYVKEGDSGAADSKRAFSDFGIMPQGHMILVGKDELPKIVEDLEKLFSPDT